MKIRPRMHRRIPLHATATLISAVGTEQQRELDATVLEASEGGMQLALAGELHVDDELLITLDDFADDLKARTIHVYTDPGSAECRVGIQLYPMTGDVSERYKTYLKQQRFNRFRAPKFG